MQRSAMPESANLQPNLFPSEKAPLARPPLAARMRPKDFSAFLGQDDVIGEGQPLRQTIEADQLTSLILWGPPGSGKTTLAGIIAQKSQSVFVPFSAVLGGVPELRTILKEAQRHLALSGQRTILFVDEIHRFNKAQQDAFLPHVERGDIILIGATTQNPSFEIIAPLLSRCLVVVLHPLDEQAIGEILNRALTDTKRGLGSFGIQVTPTARQQLIRYGNGDARSALTALEFVVNHLVASGTQGTVIDQQQVQAALQQQSLRYDRDGEEHYNLISAFIKSMRDSDADGALYWLARMIEGGEDPRFIARRMVIFSSEDIGNADPQALIIATAVFQALEIVGLPEARINLAQGTTYLATAPKSNASYAGIEEALRDVRELGNLPVPLHLRNAVTPLMKSLGYGKDYRYVHDDPTAQTEQTHLPEPLKQRRYYRLT